MNFFHQMSLRFKILSIVTLALLLCASIAIGSFLYFNKQEFYRGIISKSHAIHLRLDASTKYVATQNGLGPIIERMKEKYKSPDEMSKEDKENVLKQVPIVAAMKIGAMDADKDSYEFRVFSDEARNEGNRADAKELEIFKLFEKNSSLKEHIINDGNFLTVYRPVHLSESQGCLNCHGDPVTSPWGNGRDILGYKMENWKDGKLHGVFAIKTDINKLMHDEESKYLITPSNILIMAIASSGIIALIFATVIIRSPINTLNTITSALSNSGNIVNETASKIAQTSEEFSQASTEQASSLQETSASIEEISKMIAANTENAANSVSISKSSQDNAEKGKKVVDKMISSITSIDKNNQNIMGQIDITNKEIEKIVSIINEIGSKTKVINEIVFQTKLLSFNASVEAARAGEHGKGFAVVAEEVGNLAQMSGNAATEITEMLERSITTVESIARDSKTQIGIMLETSKKEVQNGVSVAHECEEVLNQIVESVANVSRLLQDISHASTEQSTGVHEITKAVAQLDQVTQQNTHGAHHGAEAAAKLSDEANELNNLVNQLKKIING